MPAQNQNQNPSNLGERADAATTSLRAILRTLEIVAQRFKTPFLDPIVSSSLVILDIVAVGAHAFPRIHTRLNIDRQQSSQNTADSIRLLEQVSELLYIIASLHVAPAADSDPDTDPRPVDIPLPLLDAMAQFTETLTKIKTFLEAQQQGSRIRKFFRQAEMTRLLRACQVGLQQALDEFKMKSARIQDTIHDLETNSGRMHEEIMELIARMVADDTGSTFSDRKSSYLSSCNSLTLLPSEPKIFHGREQELESIISAFSPDGSRGGPRIAILGMGGMGKTTLARAVLHHPTITNMYPVHNRFFVSCEIASTAVDVIATVAEHLDLKLGGRNHAKSVVKWFVDHPAALLILDNFETCWENESARDEIEEFLSLLSEVQHLSIVITMRGAERPGKVRWTRPFLPSLAPLSRDAARNIFVDITDGVHSVEEMDSVLDLTDNMPLAIDLIAHLVVSDGCDTVLARWKDQNTAVLSEGHDRRSNLDSSIALSLSSPRLAALPGARSLLSILALLPDGLTDAQLVQMNVPIPDILRCKSALLRTSLAYLTPAHRLKVLVPIREYALKVHPLTEEMMHPISSYFFSLVRLFRSSSGRAGNPGLVSLLAANSSNVASVLDSTLLTGHRDLAPAILCAISFDSFLRVVLCRGRCPAIRRVPDLLIELENEHELHVRYATNDLLSLYGGNVRDLRARVEQNDVHLMSVHDPSIKCQFYDAAGSLCRILGQDMPYSIRLHRTALEIAVSHELLEAQSDSLNFLGQTYLQMGNPTEGRVCVAQAFAAAVKCGVVYSQAVSLHIDARCSQELGEFVKTLELCSRASELLALCDMSECGLSLGIAAARAQVHLSKTEYTEARAIQVKSRFRAQNDEDPYQHAHALMNLAEIDIALGADASSVESMLDDAKKLFGSIHFDLAVTVCDMILTDLWLRDAPAEYPSRAGPILLRLVAELRGRHNAVEIELLRRLADGANWSSYDLHCTVTYLALAATSRDRLALHQALMFLGDVMIHEHSDWETAGALFRVALDGFSAMDVHRAKGECLLRMSEIAEKKEKLWRVARECFERAKQDKMVQHLDSKLADS
ncbi:unnamed protein product [Mycena citricolor]|uniref:Novel STAND NTPase 1 domain-containing protein n=1 Tax=Mycena citricolor TaxID=2018698 RepID=A0AAD2HTX7_9AGAR|nr:unnamed protein product [Mycena citricolor]